MFTGDQKISSNNSDMQDETAEERKLNCLELTQTRTLTWAQLFYSNTHTHTQEGTHAHL